jgi:hypothetical protein
MRFLGIRLGVDRRGLPLRSSLKRLVGLSLAVLTLGIGFLGILFDPRRRGWQDRLAGVDVLYEPREVAPWSTLEAESPTEEARTTKAPDSRGLRPQQVAGR